MKTQMTIGYQNRTGAHGDLPTAPKITLANHVIQKVCGFSVGERVAIEYSPNQIIITKLT